MVRVVAVVVFLIGPVWSQESLDHALVTVRTAPASKRAAAVRAVLETGASADAILERLRKGSHAPPSLEPGWHMREVKGRPYQLYVPKGLPAEPVPLLVHMHGGVGRPDFRRQKSKVGYGGMFWPELAEKHKFVVVFPEARFDCVWWSDAGVEHVRACVREAKRFASIDDDAVLGTGFSDGGSGCFYLAMAAPDPFAAFLPMNGHPAVGASAGKRQLYLHNLVGSPLFVAMTTNDQLYPAAQVLPHLQPALALGAPMHLVNYPTGGHQPVYFAEQKEAFARFITDTPRDPHPTELTWRCGEVSAGRYRWVEVLEIGATAADAAAQPDINMMSTAGRVRLGVHIDTAYTGGVRIRKVVEKSTAAEMGMRDGDVLLALDGKPMADLKALRAALAKKKHGQAVTARVKRGETETRLEGRVAEHVPALYYKRAKPTARIAVEVEGAIIRVTVRHVRRFKLHLTPEVFGNHAVTVIVNGKEAPAKTVPVPIEKLLLRYAREADAGRLFTREVTVEVR